ncbi:MAG TPA: CbiX/SirB N-terminal domain-containing protein [Burkholderiales bacterium]|nr:CbiX/SirB N-terminal domain-containing protein [Burkholderiales bacterium]
MSEAIVLFAHGSRDAGWAVPFESLASEVKKRAPQAEVALAFLELMKPSLAEAVKKLSVQNVRRVRIVPVFLAAGGHVRADLPRLVDALRTAHPGMQFEVDAPIGEQATVLAAIAESISRPGARSSR